MANTTDLRIDIASEFTGAQAFGKAEKATKTLSSSVKKLAAALGIAYGVNGLARYSKEAVAGFVAEQKQVLALTNTVRNLGLEFANPSILAYINSLSRMSGVLDDELRPAMQRLLQVTGSVSASQKILAQSIEVSRATGVDLLTVSQDLAQAYVGNLRGLRKYNLGLTQAELQASSFADIQARLNTLFAGSSQAYLESYAGQMDRLKVAAAEAKDEIGRGLVTAISNLNGGGSDGLQRSISLIDSLSTGLGKLFERLGAGTNAWGKLLSGDISGAVAVAKGISTKPAYTGAIPSIQSAVAASQQKKAEAAAVKRNKELIALQKKQLSATKAITASKKASAVFDMDQIQIVAALKGKITEEESIRLRLQSAILMGNNSEAARLTVELSKTAGMTKELSTWLANLPTAKNPFEAWQSYLDGILNTIRTIATVSSTHVGGTGMADFGGASYELPTNPYAGTYYGETGRDPMPVNITISTTDQFTNALRYDLVDSSMSGSFAQLNRNVSSF